MSLALTRYGIGVVFVFAAVIQDIKEYKIKNVTVLIFIVLGLAFSTFAGRSFPFESIAGMLFPLIMLPLFALKMIGAGDIKAFCALGAIFGFPEIVKIMVISVLCGGIIGLFFIIFRKNCADRIKYLILYLKTWLITKTVSAYNGITKKDAVFRFAYAIFAGVIIYILCKVIGISVV